MTKSEIHLREKVCYRAEVRPTGYFVNAFSLIKVKLNLKFLILAFSAVI